MKLVETACWPWDGYCNADGYGVARTGGRTQLVHRVAFEEFHGPIPEGLEIDHLCHTADPDCPGGIGCRHRRCWRPDHLRLVTPGWHRRQAGLSTGRKNRAKTHCPAGHVYDRVLSSGARQCSTCQRDKKRARYAADPERYRAQNRAKYARELERSRAQGRERQRRRRETRLSG